MNMYLDKTVYSVYETDFRNNLRQLYCDDSYYKCRKWIKNRAKNDGHTSGMFVSKLNYTQAWVKYVKPNLPLGR